jgi:hypothetical protein
MAKKSTKAKLGTRCGSKAQVMRGTADFTRGLSKEDMVKTKNGKIVNATKSKSASKKKSPHLALMNKARVMAMEKFPGKGKCLFEPGSAINKERSRIYQELKEDAAMDEF